MPNTTNLTNEIKEVQNDLSIELILLDEHNQLKVLKAALHIAKELTNQHPQARQHTSFELITVQP